MYTKQLIINAKNKCKSSTISDFWLAQISIIIIVKRNNNYYYA